MKELPPDELGDLKSIGSTAQYDGFRNAFEAVGIKSKKKTHAPRGVAARNLADLGIFVSFNRFRCGL